MRVVGAPPVKITVKVLVAVRIDRCELPTAKEYKSLRQTPVPLYPILNRQRIRRCEQSRCTGRGEFPAILVHKPGGMEAQNGPRRDTNLIAWNGAQHEGAGREARPVDYDPFPGLSKSLEEIQELPDFATWARKDPHIREGGPKHDEE